MSSYNEVDGVLTSADRFVLTETLHGAWNFSGYVTADFGAVRHLVTTHCTAVRNLVAVHCTAETPKEATRQFIAGGGNMQGYDYPTDQATPPPGTMPYQRSPGPESSQVSHQQSRSPGSDRN
jgi:hypothetical protein